MARRTKAEGSVEDSFEELSGDGASRSGVADSAKQVAAQAKETARGVLDQAKDQAASRVDQQRESIASGIQAVAQAFRSMGDELKGKEQGPVAEYAAEFGHAISGKVEQVASYLQGRDVHQLLGETENFARRSPAVFLGSAFILGLAASRFLKSSRPAPDFIANMPDPNRALPPASTPSEGAGYSGPEQV